MSRLWARILRLLGVRLQHPTLLYVDNKIVGVTLHHGNTRRTRKS